MEATVLSGQTLCDIALQYAGSLQAVAEIARANDIPVSDPLEPGTVLIIPRVIDAQVADYYRSNGVFPKSDITGPGQAALIEGGLEFMGIEIDFFIS